MLFQLLFYFDFFNQKGIPYFSRDPSLIMHSLLKLHLPCNFQIWEMTLDYIPRGFLSMPLSKRNYMAASKSCTFFPECFFFSISSPSCQFWYWSIRFVPNDNHVYFIWRIWAHFYLGSDLSFFAMQASADYSTCMMKCYALKGCVAWSFAPKYCLKPAENH